MQPIGTLEKILRYPVKSMGGERMKEVLVTEHGLEGDRVYAVVEKAEREKFPWLTGRQEQDMVRFRAYLSKNEQGQSEALSLVVENPEGKRFEDEESLLAHLQERFSKTLRLSYRETGIPDSAPVSLLGLQSVATLEQEFGSALDPQRFRANLLLSWIDDQSRVEDALIGKNIQLGDTVRLHIQERSSRCRMITLDPETGESNKDVLNHVAGHHEGCVGVYATVLTPGIVHESDTAYLLSSV